MTVPVDDPSEPLHASTGVEAPEEAADPQETDPAAPAGRPAIPSVRTRTHEPTIAEICPYLTAASGAWRSASPQREHRCGAIDPPGPLSSEKQRRLCLAIEHAGCPTFRAARASRAAMLAPGLDPSAVAAADAARRPITRTAPLILEQARLSAPTARWPLDRALPQVVLVVLMVLAFVAIAVARLSTNDAGGPGAPSASPSIVSSPSATPQRTPSPTPSPSASTIASSVPSASATASEAPFRTTYKVKKGDTLVGIASAFDTTVAAIRKANGLSNDATLRVGQVLKIP